MPARTRKPIPKVDKAEATELAEVDAGIARTSDTLELTDELLDEIDEILDVEAEQLANFRQKGGE